MNLRVQGATAATSDVPCWHLNEVVKFLFQL